MNNTNKAILDALQKEDWRDPIMSKSLISAMTGLAVGSIIIKEMKNG